jgi:hypothetical protein
MRDDADYRGVLRMRGLPFSTSPEDILVFFGSPSTLQLSNVHLMRKADGRSSGDAYAVFDTEEAAVGLVGDNWLERGSRSTPDGSAELAAQLNIMNIRCARLVAGDDARGPLAGDQLFVDLDLSPANLPPGTRLQIGSAVIEVTAKPHTGCAKFTRRFGLAAHRWVNGATGTRERLRGICATVVVAGRIGVGDTVTKQPAGITPPATVEPCR